MLRPKVGIVIVHYRNYDDTARCLSSIARNTYPNWWVVVVDNSPDHSSGDQLRVQFSGPRFYFTKMEGNAGFAAGCNHGAEIANRENVDYLWFLNPDTEISDEALDVLIAEASRLKDKFGSLCSLVVYGEGSSPAGPIWGAGGVIDIDKQQIQMLQTTTTAAASAKGEFGSNLLRVDYSPGCSMLIPMQVWDSVGEFDDQYFLYFEETDWCRRATNLGHSHYCAVDSLVRHFTVDSKLQSPKIVYYYNRNRLFFLWRFSSVRQRLKLFWEIVSKKLPEARRALNAATTKSQREIFRAHKQAQFDFLIGRRGILASDLGESVTDKSPTV